MEVPHWAQLSFMIVGYAREVRVSRISCSLGATFTVSSFLGLATVVLRWAQQPARMVVFFRDIQVTLAMVLPRWVQLSFMRVVFAREVQVSCVVHSLRCRLHIFPFPLWL